MQPGNPYHLIEAVGSCQVGSVWSAIDPQGRSLMVALLDPNVATDQRWREAFQEAANALVQAGEPGYLYADFASGAPWVAYSAENGIGAERVFLALGMDFQPVPPDGLGPMDYTPFEPATHETPAAPETPSTPEAPPTQVIPATPAAQAPPASVAAPVTPPQQQPLPPDVLASTEAPPTTVFPQAHPAPPAHPGPQAHPGPAPQPTPPAHPGPLAHPGPAAQPAPPVQAPPPAQPAPPAQPGPPAAESAPPAPPVHQAAAQQPAPAHVDAETTQPTQRMEPPPPPPIAPWGGGHPVSPPPQQAAPAPPPLVSGPPYPTSGAPHPTSGAPHPTSGAPHPTSGAPHPTSGGPLPTSGPPQPISGSPMSPAYGQPLSPAYGAPAYGPRPPQGPAPYDPYAPVAPPPRRSRTGLWIGIAVAVLVLIAGGGGVYAWSASGGEPNPPTQTNTATEAPLPTATPLSPGVEPPEDGNWSANWPRFADPPDKVRELILEGVGFKFLVPRDWDCQLAGSGDGFVKYNCGPGPGGAEIGGEFVVRDCPSPCDDARRIAMRKAEEAWGLQWKRGSRTSAYAETNEIDGQPRYGLVIVAYWRSTPDEAIDRQLVFRMTAPVKQADVIRKISRSMRTSALF